MYIKAIDNKSHETYTIQSVDHRPTPVYTVTWEHMNSEYRKPGAAKYKLAQDGRKMQWLTHKHITCFAMCYNQMSVASKFP